MTPDRMQYILIVLLLLTGICQAQPKPDGLGAYRLGIATTDSLSNTFFVEQEQSYVKGTIALPCSHIRTFKASEIRIGGVMIANLSLFFYDNRLFKISCDYSTDVEKMLLEIYGRYVIVPTNQLSLCSSSRVLNRSGKIWQHENVTALALYWSGYNEQCQRIETARLVLTNHTFSALASDCDLTPTEPLADEIDQVLATYRHNVKTR